MRKAFTITVDYRHGTTTGISAADRAATLRALVDPAEGLTISCGRAMSFPSARLQAASFSGLATRKRLSI